MVPPRFEDRLSSYPKWRIAVRGSVAYFAVPRETHGMGAYVKGQGSPSFLQCISPQVALKKPSAPPPAGLLTGVLRTRNDCTEFGSA